MIADEMDESFVIAVKQQQQQQPSQLIRAPLSNSQVVCVDAVREVLKAEILQ
jgi:hypothetical protein